MYEFRVIRPGVWKVLGGARTYVVSKAMRNWFCTCEAGSYRGMCKHICSIQVEDDPLRFFPHSVPDIHRLGRKAFNALWALPRFIAEPLCSGPRFILIFGSTPKFFDTIGNEANVPCAFDEEKAIELSGTVADVVAGSPFGEDRLHIQDVSMWKGSDLSHRPLRERLDYIPKVAKAAKLAPMYWAYNDISKWLLWRLLGGRCVIKDVNTPYRKTRGWFIRAKEA